MADKWIKGNMVEISAKNISGICVGSNPTVCLPF